MTDNVINITKPLNNTRSLKLVILQPKFNELLSNKIDSAIESYINKIITEHNATDHSMSKKHKLLLYLNIIKTAIIEKDTGLKINKPDDNTAIPDAEFYKKIKPLLIKAIEVMKNEKNLLLLEPSNKENRDKMLNKVEEVYSLCPNQLSNISTTTTTSTNVMDDQEFFQAIADNLENKYSNFSVIVIQPIKKHVLTKLTSDVLKITPHMNEIMFVNTTKEEIEKFIPKKPKKEKKSSTESTDSKTIVKEDKNSEVLVDEKEIIAQFEGLQVKTLT